MPHMHFEILTHKCSSAKEEQGQQMEQRQKEGTSRDCPTWGSIIIADTKPDIDGVVKMCLLTGTSCEGS